MKNLNLHQFAQIERARTKSPAHVQLALRDVDTLENHIDEDLVKVLSGTQYAFAPDVDGRTKEGKATLTEFYAQHKDSITFKHKDESLVEFVTKKLFNDYIALSFESHALPKAEYKHYTLTEEAVLLALPRENAPVDINKALLAIHVTSRDLTDMTDAQVIEHYQKHYVFAKIATSLVRLEQSGNTVDEAILVLVSRGQPHEFRVLLLDNKGENKTAGTVAMEQTHKIIENIIDNDIDVLIPKPMLQISFGISSKVSDEFAESQEEYHSANERLQ